MYKPFINSSQKSWNKDGTITPHTSNPAHDCCTHPLYTKELFAPGPRRSNHGSKPRKTWPKNGWRSEILSNAAAWNLGDFGDFKNDIYIQIIRNIDPVALNSSKHHLLNVTLPAFQRYTFSSAVNVTQALPPSLCRVGPDAGQSSCPVGQARTSGEQPMFVSLCKWSFVCVTCPCRPPKENEKRINPA